MVRTPETVKPVAVVELFVIAPFNVRFGTVVFDVAFSVDVDPSSKVVAPVKANVPLLVKVPPTVCENADVTPAPKPPVFETTTLLNVSEMPARVCILVPLKSTVPVPGTKLAAVAGVKFPAIPIVVDGAARVPPATNATL